MGIGILFFIEIVGVGLFKNCDIFGVVMFDSVEIWVYLMGFVILCMGMKFQGQGYEIIWVQIIVIEIGILVDDIMVEEGDMDMVFYGFGIYGLCFILVVGVVIVLVVWKICNKVQMIVVYMLEVFEYDFEWDVDGFQVKGNLQVCKFMKEIVWVVYYVLLFSMELGLEVVSYYDLFNMIYLFGVYFCVMDIDVDMGVVKICCFYVLDDCGMWINLMIIEGQVYGGLIEVFVIVMGQEIWYDEIGNVMGVFFMDFFLLIVVEMLYWEIDYMVILSLYYLIGVKGVGESLNVGGVLVFFNVVNDVFQFLGFMYIQMLYDVWCLWLVVKELGVYG